MPKTSAGLLVYRRKTGFPEVLLVHPGGPFWRKRDKGAWSIPKGEYGSGEDAQAAALREFAEELGSPPPAASARPLGEVVQAGGKHVIAYAVEGDLEVSKIRSNSFKMEWPPDSGRQESFPEVDRAGWFSLDVAKQKIIPGQCPFLERLEAMLTD